MGRGFGNDSIFADSRERVMRESEAAGRGSEAKIESFPNPLPIPRLKKNNQRDPFGSFRGILDSMAGATDREWSIYLIEAENGHLYAGITTDPVRRFEEHRGDPKKAAKFFRRSPPKEIKLLHHGFTRSEALRIEARLKRMSRVKKLAFLATASRDALLGLLSKE